MDYTLLTTQLTQSEHDGLRQFYNAMLSRFSSSMSLSSKDVQVNATTLTALAGYGMLIEDVDTPSHYWLSRLGVLYLLMAYVASTEDVQLFYVNELMDTMSRLPFSEDALTLNLLGTVESIEHGDQTYKLTRFDVDSIWDLWTMMGSVDSGIDLTTHMPYNYWDELMCKRLVAIGFMENAAGGGYKFTLEPAPLVAQMVAED